MKIIVDGTQIELNLKQVEVIEKRRRQRERCRNSFKRMLIHLGFKQDKEFPISFSHKKENWYAEIIDRGNYSDLWMKGDGLREGGGLEGGWMYSCPQEIEEAILDVYAKRL